MKRQSIFIEYFKFLKHEKKFWMIPIVLIFLIVGLLVILLESSAIAPFIYAIF